MNLVAIFPFQISNFNLEDEVKEGLSKGPNSEDLEDVVMQILLLWQLSEKFHVSHKTELNRIGKASVVGKLVL